MLRERTVHWSFVAFGIPFTVNAAWCDPGWNTVVWPRSIGGGEKKLSVPTGTVCAAAPSFAYAKVAS